MLIFDVDDNEGHYPKGIFARGQIELRARHNTAFLGKSGCGKSTLLKILAHIIPKPSFITWQGFEGEISYFDQNPIVMPWLKVKERLTLASQLQGKAIDYEKTEGILQRLHLWDKRDHFMSTLSGGNQQKLALASALYEDSPIWLMDEPFSALDSLSRRKMQILAKEQCKGKTLIIVTHDPMEALYLADDIYIFNDDPAQIIPYHSQCKNPKSHEDIYADTENLYQYFLSGAAG